MPEDETDLNWITLRCIANGGGQRAASRQEGPIALWDDLDEEGREKLKGDARRAVPGISDEQRAGLDVEVLDPRVDSIFAPDGE